MSKRSTSFEIYVLQRGRWELHGRHASTAREAAVEKAKTLDKLPNIEAVKVVRDVLNQSTGTSSEYTVYKSGNVDDDTDGQEASDSFEDMDLDSFDDFPDDGIVDDDDDGGTRSARSKGSRTRASGQPSSLKRGILKLILIVGGSALLSALITGIVAVTLTELPELRRAIGLGQADYNNVLFAVFIISFLFTVGSSAYTFISSKDLAPGPNAPRDKRSRAQRFEAAEAKEWQKAMRPSRSARQRAKDATKRTRNLADGEEEDDTLDLTPGGDEPAETVAATDEEPAETKSTPATPLSSNAEQQKVNVMTFLSKGLETVMKTQPKLDKFGVNLFLAGACEAAGSAGNLDDGETAQILMEGVEILGTKAEQAQKFAQAYDSYLLDPKYLGMIEAGRDAMQITCGAPRTQPTSLIPR